MNKNFLKDLGFGESIEEKIVENSSIQMYESLILNEYECIKIISFLRKMGIKCIKELIIYKTELFLNTLDEVVVKFNNVDSTIIDKINKNYLYIENI